MNRAGNLSRLFAPIALPSVTGGRARCFDGVQERVVVGVSRAIGRRDVDDRDEAGDVRRRRRQQPVEPPADDRDAIEPVVRGRPAARRQLDDDAHACSSDRRWRLLDVEQRLAPRDAAEPRVHLRAAHELRERAAAVRRGAVAGPQQADGAPPARAGERRVAHPVDDDDRGAPRRAESRAQTPSRARQARRPRTGEPRAGQRDGAAGPSVVHSHRITPRNEGSTVGRRRLLLEQLLEARCALERGEPGGCLQPLLAPAPHHAAAAGSRDRRRGADEPAQQKIPRSRARPPRRPWDDCALRIANASVTSCSTWSCCSRSRSLPAATCAPRAGREPEARRPTSRPGRRSSAPRRGASRSAATTRRASSSRESSQRTASSSSGRSAEGTTGVVVSIVHAGDRSLASDRGVAPSFAPDELDPAWVDCDVLHLSGYALLREPIAATALLAARLAREQGARVSVDVAAWTEIRSYGPVQFRELLDELAPDVLFATEAEWELLGGAYLTRADRRAEARRARLHRLHRGREARLRRASRRRSSTRPAPATRSPRASCSAAPSRRRRGAGSRRPLAASRK